MSTANQYIARPEPAAGPAAEDGVAGEARRPDWRWQMRARLRTVDDYAAHLRLSSAERAALADPRIPEVATTPYYLSLMNPDDPRCPIRRQALPDPEDAQAAPGETDDPLGERDHNPAHGVVHRYPDRALLLVATDCPVFCRHCNRRAREPDEYIRTRRGLTDGLDYLRRTPEVHEVILSGGDPLTLGDGRLEYILEQLRTIEHVRVIRVGTRIPVVCPMRVTDGLADLLRRFAPVYVVTHFNHPREITPEATEACDRLIDRGVPVANHTVLMRGINSDVRVLAELCRELHYRRVRPYYVLQLDPVVGTERFKTPVRAGIEMVSALRGRLPGLAIPQFVLDAPGGDGKVILLTDAVVSEGPGVFRVRTWRGTEVDYPDTGSWDLACPT